MSGQNTVNSGNSLILLPCVLTVNNLYKVADFAEESVNTGTGFFGKKGVKANNCYFNGIFFGGAESFLEEFFRCLAGGSAQLFLVGGKSAYQEGAVGQGGVGKNNLNSGVCSAFDSLNGGVRLRGAIAIPSILS